MNTPRTKKPTRWQSKTSSAPREGARLFGIHEPEVQAAYGFVVSYWPQVEERMIGFLAELINGSPPEGGAIPMSARRIFRSIIAPTAKIKVMRDLLENSYQNADKPSLYDELIDEYASLNGARNNYVHALWWTSHGKTLMSHTDQDYLGHFDDLKTVTAAELTSFAARMRDFFTRLEWRRNGGLPPSLDNA